MAPFHPQARRHSSTVQQRSPKKDPPKRVKGRAVGRSAAGGEAEGAAEGNPVVRTGDVDLVGRVRGERCIGGHIALVGLKKAVGVICTGHAGSHYDRLPAQYRRHGGAIDDQLMPFLDGDVDRGPQRLHCQIAAGGGVRVLVAQDPSHIRRACAWIGEHVGVAIRGLLGAGAVLERGVEHGNPTATTGVGGASVGHVANRDAHISETAHQASRVVRRIEQVLDRESAEAGLVVGARAVHELILNVCVLGVRVALSEDAVQWGDAGKQRGAGGLEVGRNAVVDLPVGMANGCLVQPGVLLEQTKAARAAGVVQCCEGGQFFAGVGRGGNGRDLRSDGRRCRRLGRGGCGIATATAGGQGGYQEDQDEGLEGTE